MDSCSPEVFAQFFTEDEKSLANLDTNILSLTFGDVPAKQQALSSSVPVACSHCHAIFSCFSAKLHVDEYKSFLSQQKSPKLQEKAAVFKEISAAEAVWICEFCETHNVFPSATLQNPAQPDAFFRRNADKLQENEEEKLDFRAKSTVSGEETVIFCVDNSGSMSGTNLRCVKTAISSQIRELSEKFPKKRVGFVTFESNIEVFGDCSKSSEVLPRGFFEDFEKSLSFGRTFAEKHELQPIASTSTFLEKTLGSIYAKGSTALGPGLLISLGILLQNAKSTGSMIVLCTDGQANEGLGSMDSEGSEKFYRKAGEFAKEHGIIISVLTIKGGECRVDKLSILTELTGGMVSRIKPTRINKDFNKAMQGQLIGTDAKICVHLPRALSFRNENPANLQENGYLCVKTLGNVTVATEESFEFRFRTKKELQLLGISPEELQELHVQARVEYTSVDGDDLLRVSTLKLRVSKNEADVKKTANVKIVAMRASHDVAKEADNGNFLVAKQKIKKWNEFLEDQLFPLNKDNEEFAKYYEVVKKKNEDFAKQINKNLARKIKKKDDNILKAMKEMSSSEEEELKKSLAANSSSGSSDECEAMIKKFKKKRQASFVFYSDDCASMSDGKGKNSNVLGNQDSDSGSDQDISNIIKKPMRIDSGIHIAQKKPCFEFDSGDEELQKDLSFDSGKNKGKKKQKASVYSSDSEEESEENAAGAGGNPNQKLKSKKIQQKKLGSEEYLS